jgi:hypothetical protein
MKPLLVPLGRRFLIFCFYFISIKVKENKIIMKIKNLDHLVLTVSDVKKTIEFYTKVLGMSEETFSNNRKALRFGNPKINIHKENCEFEPKIQIQKSDQTIFALLLRIRWLRLWKFLLKWVYKLLMVHANEPAHRVLFNPFIFEIRMVI